jgi:6-phosphofructokinase
LRRIAIITGGGDCAGINSFIASVAQQAMSKYKLEVLGIKSAFEGACSDNPESFSFLFKEKDLFGLRNQPSTILGSSRFAPFSDKNKAALMPEKLMANLKSLGVEALVLTGGDDTLKTALFVDQLGIPVMAAPKGIDNDVSGTDVMLGYRTAVDFGSVAVRSTTVSARTHRRISVLEIMGRKAGWLALETGIAGEADVILIPEHPLELKRVLERIKRFYDKQGYCSVVVSEGAVIPGNDPVFQGVIAKSPILKALVSEDVAYDEHGNPKLGGIGQIMRRIIAMELGFDSLDNVRATDLGFMLRGLPPGSSDIVLGTRFGIAAIDMLMDGVHGKVVVLKGDTVEALDINAALKQKTVDWADDVLRSAGVCW